MRSDAVQSISGLDSELVVLMIIMPLLPPVATGTSDSEDPQLARQADDQIREILNTE